MTTHTPLPLTPTPNGWMGHCECGYRTRKPCKTVVNARNLVLRHIQYAVRDPAPTPEPEPSIDIHTAATRFLDLLFLGLDENTPAQRAGHRC